MLPGRAPWLRCPNTRNKRNPSCHLEITNEREIEREGRRGEKGREKRRGKGMRERKGEKGR